MTLSPSRLDLAVDRTPSREDGFDEYGWNVVPVDVDVHDPHSLWIFARKRVTHPNPDFSRTVWSVIG